MRGAMPGQATSNEKAPLACNTTEIAIDLNFANGQRQRKAITTQVEVRALAGHAQHELRCDFFLVSQYAQNYYAHGYAHIQAFFRKLGLSK